MDTKEQIQTIDLDRLEKQGFYLIVKGRLRHLPGGRVADAILKEFEAYAREKYQQQQEIWKAPIPIKGDNLDRLLISQN